SRDRRVALRDERLRDLFGSDELSELLEEPGQAARELEDRVGGRRHRGRGCGGEAEDERRRPGENPNSHRNAPPDRGRPARRRRIWKKRNPDEMNPKAPPAGPRSAGARRGGSGRAPSPPRGGTPA